MTICIAGKGYIAVKALSYIQKTRKEKIYAMPLANDIGVDSWLPSLKRFSDTIGIECISFEECKEIKPKIIISLEYDRIFKLDQFPATDIFNIHFSKLPEYKGMATSSWPIFNGEKEVGVTLHLVDQGIDTGPIIAQTTFFLDDNETAQSLYSRFHQIGFELFKKNISKIIAGDFEAKNQSHFGSSYYSKGEFEFTKELNMNKTAFQISSEFRAKFFPAFQLPSWNGEEFKHMEILNSRSSDKAGTILNENQHYLEVSTVDYDIRLFKSA